MKPFSLLFLLTALLIATGCGSPDIPAQYTPSETRLNLYPDYTGGITIPPNICPLNFLVRNEGDRFIAVLSGKDKQLKADARADGKIIFDETEWDNLLAANRNSKLTLTVYAETESGWVRYPDETIRVAAEEIDPYLSYRLIEPGYELYRQVGLYQRNLTNYEVKTIYENNRTFDAAHNHCVNCHNYQAYSTRNMLFHVRGMHGGTLIAANGSIGKINPKNDSILGSAVYPSWHPTQPWIAFSSNKTGQTFHMAHSEKVEVVDTSSDLIFYDAQEQTVSNILRTRETLETFPCWHPDGTRLYYCAVTLPALASLPDSLHARYIIAHYDSIRYNVMRIDFDPSTRRFGTPEVEVDCQSAGKSASVPRVSPDGRYLLFTLGDYGQFHIWHKSADLYVKDLRNGEVRRLDHANSTDVDSYHTWSSNGRWIVFSSRRDDGSYTRPYIAYFDPSGQDGKAFMLPQADPEQNLLLLKSYNVPELTKDAVMQTPEDFRKVIYETEAKPVSYK